MWEISVTEQRIRAITTSAGTHPRARIETTLNDLPATGEAFLYSGWTYKLRLPVDIPQYYGDGNNAHVIRTDVLAFNIEGRTW